MNKETALYGALAKFGLDKSDANVYLELLRKPATHAQLSTATGINRTTLYRVVKRLQKQNLVKQHIDDRGKLLVAVDPAALEVEVLNHETHTQQLRRSFDMLLPTLLEIRQGFEADFSLSTYEGVEGFKRMLWNELKAKGSCICLGNGRIEDLVESRSWAEKHRQLSVDAGYKIREISNPGELTNPESKVGGFDDLYELRIVPHNMLTIHYMVCAYNDTVAIYHRRGNSRIGLEITSRYFAETFRSMLEFYWSIAIPEDKLPTRK